MLNLSIQLEEGRGRQIHLVVVVGEGPHRPTVQAEEPLTPRQEEWEEEHTMDLEEEGLEEEDLEEEDLPLPEEEEAAEALVALQEEDPFLDPRRYRPLNLL
jgi:hypothetical protein